MHCYRKAGHAMGLWTPEKTARWKISKTQTFQRPNLWYFNLTYLWLCYILNLILHSHSWIAPDYRDRTRKECWPLTRKETLSLSHHCSPCTDVAKGDCIWIILGVFWQDSKHCRSCQTLKDNEQEISSIAFRYLLYRNIPSIERCKDIIWVDSIECCYENKSNYLCVRTEIRV